jgi:PilZ domain
MFGPSGAAGRSDSQKRGMRLDRRKPVLERRKWPRLPLAIPVFVRSQDQGGKEFLEFASALNISAGGALVAVHRSLKPAVQVSLEIPSAPLANSAPMRRNSRNLRGKIVRVAHAEGYHLLGLKFTHPLANREAPPVARRRKVASSV